jgi:hypothetical protein
MRIIHTSDWHIGVAALVALGCVGLTACSAATPAADPTTRAPSSTEAAAPSTTGTTTGPPAPPATASVPSGIGIGPGTQAVYVVEPQPAPGSCHYGAEGGDPLPDPHCTPGAVNPQVTQADIGSTICLSGWTATVRPPESVTGPEKAGSALAYGYTGPFSTGEYDHLIPLELGGDPNDSANLWVEPNEDPAATSTHNAKDDLEGRLRDLVCAGSLTLADAQAAIATDWVAAARRYGS